MACAPVYLKASNAGMRDEFGTAVALAGDTLVVTASVEDSSGKGVDAAQNNDNATDSGAVYAFERVDGVWSQIKYIKPNDTVEEMEFGTSVALDQDWLVVGAPKSSGGSAYVFERALDYWVPRSPLKASNAGGGDEFGRFVAVQATTMVVTAFNEDSAAKEIDGDEDDDSASSAGAAYVFDYDGANWTQSAYLKPFNTGAGDIFGGALALSGDTVVISSRREDSASSGVNGDGSDDTAPNSGAVYVFDRVDGSWVQSAYLKASNPGAGDEFGSYLSIDGDTLAVSARLEDSSATGIDGDEANENFQDSGAVYVFVRSGGTWAQQAYIKASNTGTGHVFGYRLALKGDILAVSATSYRTGGMDNVGVVYVFRRVASQWQQVDIVEAPAPSPGKSFGSDLALDDKRLIVGAFGDASGVATDPLDTSAPRAGAVYVF